MRELPMQDDGSMDRLREEATDDEKRIQGNVEKALKDQKKQDEKKKD